MEAYPSFIPGGTAPGKKLANAPAGSVLTAAEMPSCLRKVLLDKGVDMYRSDYSLLLTTIKEKKTALLYSTVPD
jgi:hypothetical protein